METLEYHDGSSWKSVSYDASQGLKVSGLSEELEWDFTGTDDAPSTTVTAFSGGRPSDR